MEAMAVVTAIGSIILTVYAFIGMIAYDSNYKEWQPEKRFRMACILGPGALIGYGWGRLTAWARKKEVTNQCPTMTTSAPSASNSLATLDQYKTDHL